MSNPIIKSKEFSNYDLQGGKLEQWQIMNPNIKIVDMKFYTRENPIEHWLIIYTEKEQTTNKDRVAKIVKRIREGFK